MKSFTQGTILLSFLILLGSCSASKQMRQKAIHSIQEPKTLEEVQQYALGEWESLTVELRPTEDRTGSGNINPTYLKRKFIYQPNNKFIGIITLFGDNYGQMPLMQFEFVGETKWGKAHAIADGAWEIDYILNEGFGVTPLHDQAAAMLNQALPEGMTAFKTGEKKDILQKAFSMFNIKEGQIAADYDLIYFKNGLLFMGAKHVDGTPFDQPERRPHQLQIPLQKVMN